MARIHVYEATNRRTKAKYHAVAPEMPGTPPIGIGRTPLEAVGSLVVAMSVDGVIWNPQGWPEFRITGLAEIKARQGT